MASPSAASLVGSANFTEDDSKFIERLIEDDLTPAKQSIKFTALVAVNHSQKKAHEKQMADTVKLETLAQKWSKELVIITECRVIIVGTRPIFGKYKRLSFSLLTLNDYYSNGSPTKDMFVTSLGFQVSGNDVEYLDLSTSQQHAKDIFQYIWKQISFFKNCMPEESYPKLYVPERFVKLFNKTDSSDQEKNKDSIKQLYLACCDLKGLRPCDCIWKTLNEKLGSNDKKLDLGEILGIDKFVKNPKKPTTPDDVACLAAAIEFNPFFETIECTDTDLGEDWLFPLKDPIANNTSIRKIKLSRVLMTRKTAIAYGRALKNRTSREPLRLKDLDLSKNDLGEGGVRELFEGLELGAVKLVSLNIADTQAGIKGLKAVMHLLNTDTHLRVDGLRKLNLAGNQLGKHSSESLSDFLLKSKSLEKLVLSRTGFYAKSIFLALTSNRDLKLVSLDVSENVFKKAAVELLCQLIREKECVKNYNLSRISFSKQHLTDILKDVIKTKPEIPRFVLDFSNSNLGEYFVKALQTAVESRKSKDIGHIIGLHLQNMNLGISGITELCETFKTFSSLETLNLSQNFRAKLFQRKDEATIALSQLVQTLKNLRNLYLNGNEENYFGAHIRPLFEALKENKSLIKFSAQQNNIKFADIEILADSLAKNKTLKILDLDHNLFSTRALQKLIETALASETLISVEIFDDIALRAKGKKNLLKSFQEKVEQMDDVFVANGRDIFFSVEAHRESEFLSTLDDDPLDKIVTMMRSPRALSIVRNEQEEQVKVNPLDIPSWNMPQFGRALREYQCVHIEGYTKPLPAVLVLMERYMFKNGGLESEGIFRLAPDGTESIIVKEELNDGTFEECSDVNCIANNIKVWFRELPANEKLLGEIPVNKFGTAPAGGVPALIDMVSEPRKTILLWLLDLCVSIVQNSQTNKMGPVNLAICFAPNLANFDGLDPMAGLQASKDVQTFFEHAVIWRSSNGHVPVRLHVEEHVDKKKGPNLKDVLSTEDIKSIEELAEDDEEEEEEEKVVHEQAKHVGPTASVRTKPPAKDAEPPVQSRDSIPATPSPSEDPPNLPSEVKTSPQLVHKASVLKNLSVFENPAAASTDALKTPEQGSIRKKPLSEDKAKIAQTLNLVLDPTKMKPKRPGTGGPPSLEVILRKSVNSDHSPPSPPQPAEDDEEVSRKSKTFRGLPSKASSESISGGGGALKDVASPVHSPPSSISSSPPVRTVEENFTAILNLRSQRSAEKKSPEAVLNALRKDGISAAGDVVPVGSLRGASRQRTAKGGKAVKLVKDVEDGLAAAFGLNPHAYMAQLMKERELITKDIGNGVWRFFLTDSTTNAIDGNTSEQKDDDECSVSNSVSTVVVVPFKNNENSEEKRIEKRALVIQELIDTEVSYVGHLSQLISVYQMPMKEQAAELEVSSADIMQMFGNVEIIRNFHLKLLKELEAAKEIGVPQVFLKFADFFKIYFDYCGKYDSAIEKIHSFSQKEKFRRFLQIQAAQIYAHDITSFLIMPVQRIPRYELLLKEMRKYSADEQEAQTITEALGKIHALAKHVNEKTAEFERTAKLMEIQNQIKGAKKNFSIFSPSRHLIDQFDCEEILVYSVVGELHRFRSRRMYLFNDILMWVNRDFEYRGHYLLSSKVFSINDYVHKASSDNKNFCFEICYRSDRIVLSCASETMKQDIIKSILITSEFCKS